MTQGSSFLATLGWMMAIPSGFLNQHTTAIGCSFDCNLETDYDVRKLKSIQQNNQGLQRVKLLQGQI
jgi:hypothetical protein